MEAYLDNSATTRVDAQVQELMKKLMDVDFGNPSSRHQKGVVAEGYIKEARQKIAATLKVDPKELIITSGGTESNNMALIGTALAAKRKGNHIITTAVEHPSVKATASFLEEQGFRITFLSVDSRGQISLEDLKEALTPDTILVSIMYVNNEIGTIQPVEEAAKLVHATVPGAVFHVDAIQAYGKVMIRPKQQGIDLLSVSSHKFHGPKGAGFLYCSSKVNLHPIIFGGGQQSGMRSGTENVPGAAGMGLAAQLAYQKFEQKKAFFEKAAEFLNAKYGAGTVTAVVKDSYYNMKEKIEPHMELIHIAEDAMRKNGVTPVISPVRGGTDGARLSYMGLPCPNLCTGGHNYHGKYEYVCVESMEQTVNILTEIVKSFAVGKNVD